jgi:hypothetical protein
MSDLVKYEAACRARASRRPLITPPARRCEIVGEMALEEFAARVLRAAET